MIARLAASSFLCASWSRYSDLTLSRMEIYMGVGNVAPRQL